MSKVRDLEADLTICEAATPGPWIFNGNEIVASNDKRKGIAGALADEDCQFIAEAREGWSYAIRRALAAEAEVKRLREERDFWVRKVTRLARELEQRENEIDRLRNELNILQEQLEQRCAQV
jgi:hypothetical protein